MSDEGHSLLWLTTEETELQKDLKAFMESYGRLCHRLEESAETDRPRRPLLHEWSGARAACGSLEMAIHAIERTLAEVRMLIQKIKDGEIRNIDVPVFGSN